MALWHSNNNNNIAGYVLLSIGNSGELDFTLAHMRCDLFSWKNYDVNNVLMASCEMTLLYSRSLKSDLIS